jgi:threonyl-tRNA synthetase
MEQVRITLKDGSAKEVEKGTTILELAKGISGRLAKEAMAGEIDGNVVDLNYELDKDCEVNILKFDDEGGADVFRHTSAHILAQAVKKLYPKTTLAIGPAIENGYYYDFDSEHKFTPEDLEKIEKEMTKIAKEDLQIERFELPRDEALKYMEEKGEGYKVELITDLPEDAVISFYKQGDFVDLCAGPHLPSTKPVKALKLLSLAGAYWRGDEKNKMLQRIYGTSFPKKKLLEEHIHRLEEAKKRDHRKLGKELKLFTILEEGPGFPFFLPKGMELKNTLMDYWREVHKKWGYVQVETPIILNRKLWETSGHWYHYKENMYTLRIDDEDYAIKPMNCPGGMLVYNTEMRSYRDFPMRLGEVGRVHRHELSGALHGLMRVRAFTQDDAHIFMLPEQIKDEIKGVAKLIDEVYTKFGFKYHVELSTRPEDSMGSDEDWEMAENSLKEALEELGLPYKINEGDGAFYGPKIDFQLEDCIGRTWQCGTIQLDFQLPQRFELTYVGKDGEKHRPIVIHRVAFGSIERFIGILIEHFAGKFPTWLAPEQVRVLPITDRHIDYAENVAKKMDARGIKAEVDGRSEKIGYKIREAQLQKVPYMLIVGDKESETQTVSVRSRDRGELGSQEIDNFIEQVINEIENRILSISEE